MCENILLNTTPEAILGLSNITRKGLEEILDACSVGIFMESYPTSDYDELCRVTGEAVINTIFTKFISEKAQEDLGLPKDPPVGTIVATSSGHNDTDMQRWEKTELSWRLLPEEEAEENYLCIEEMIENWDAMDLNGLMQFLIDSSDFCEYGRIEKRSIDGTWEVATGGWSDNEDIICAMQQNKKFFWAMNWKLSTRGGYYEFGKE